MRDKKWELVFLEVAVPEMEKAKLVFSAAMNELALCRMDNRAYKLRYAEVWKNYKAAINKTRKDYLSQKKALALQKRANALEGRT